MAFSALLALRNFVVLTFALGAYAALDICVLESIIKPAAAKMGYAPEDLSFFNYTLGPVTSIIWHFFYVPAGAVLLGYAGFAVNGWRGLAAGVLLFAMGYEDWLYYILQGKLMPPELKWLDLQPFVSWTRLVFNDKHVSRNGMILATSIGLLIALALLGTKSSR